MLDDHRRRERELARDATRALEIGEVVVGELLAAELLDLREQVPARAELAVVRGRLVRVLAVGELGHLAERERQLLRERVELAEPVGDRRLVGRGRLERFAREATLRLERDRAVLAQLVEHGAVLVLARDRRDVREVLRGGAQHRRPADIDHLDDLGFGDAAPARERRERIEVDADDVERLDPLLGERRDVLG